MYYTITLASGETITGTPNYTNRTHVEIVTRDGDWRWISWANVVSHKRVAR